MIIEGYASLFGIPDLEGDVVRAGAFRESLAKAGERGVAMLLRHDPRLLAGRWRELKEDARGLYVRGEIDASERAASLARRLIARGVDGLSIGFTAQAARMRPHGRELIKVELWEVSIVDVPMAPQARLKRAVAPAL